MASCRAHHTASTAAHQCVSRQPSAQGRLAGASRRRVGPPDQCAMMMRQEERAWTTGAGVKEQGTRQGVKEQVRRQGVKEQETRQRRPAGA